MPKKHRVKRQKYVELLLKEEVKRDAYIEKRGGALVCRKRDRDRDNFAAQPAAEAAEESGAFKLSEKETKKKAANAAAVAQVDVPVSLVAPVTIGTGEKQSKRTRVDQFATSAAAAAKKNE